MNACRLDPVLASDCPQRHVGWLAQVGSGGASLGRRAGRGGRPRHRGLRPPVENRSGRHRGGRALPQEWLRRRASPAPRPAHRAAVRVCAPDGTAQVLGGINGQSIARRLTAAARAAGIEGRITGHSGRVGLAVELTRRGAPEQATAKAGGWKSSRMVAHYSAAAPSGIPWAASCGPGGRRQTASSRLGPRATEGGLIGAIGMPTSSVTTRSWGSLVAASTCPALQGPAEPSSSRRA